MGYLRLLRQRPVLVLWLAESISVFGDRFFTLALTWTAWQREGAVAMGLVVVVESIPHILVGAFGRKLIARFASFRALAGVEIAQVVVVGAMPWLWDSIGLAGVLVVLALIGTADAITSPSLSALVPDLVHRDQIRRVTALMDLTGRLTWVLGPGTAAVLLVWMPAEQLFLLDAATFVVSGAAFAWLGRRFRPTARRDAHPESAASRPVTARARVILRARPHITCALALSTIGEACATVVTVGLPIWLTSRLGAGPGAYSLVLTAMGAGSLAGNLLASFTTLPGRFPGGYCLVWGARGLLLALYAVTGDVAQVGAVTAAVAILTPVTSIGLTTEVAHLPGPERLRVFAVELTGLHLAGMGSMLALPVLIVTAPALSFAVAGTVTAAASLLIWLLTRVLDRRRPAGTRRRVHPNLTRRRAHQQRPVQTPGSSTSTAVKP